MERDKIRPVEELGGSCPPPRATAKPGLARASHRTPPVAAGPNP